MDHGKELELAWAAGLFDGEGHTGFYDFSNRTTCRLMIDVCQKTPEVLWRFDDATGSLGRIYCNKNKDQWHYQAFNFNAVKVLNQIMLYLSSVKTRQALRAMKEYKEYKSYKLLHYKNPNIRKQIKEELKQILTEE